MVFEAFLERADLAADGRLAQVQRLARMGQAARVGHRVKDPQLVPVHRVLANREPRFSAQQSLRYLRAGRDELQTDAVTREFVLCRSARLTYIRMLGSDRPGEEPMSRRTSLCRTATIWRKRRVLLNGTQALVRLMLMQKARDAAAGLNTAGYVTGYRGSPLGAVDQQMARAKQTARSRRRPLPARPERGPRRHRRSGAPSRRNCAARAASTASSALWYGKGPGVDRSRRRVPPRQHGRHLASRAACWSAWATTTPAKARPCCTSPTGRWSTPTCRSCRPAGVQEVLDFGLYGWALSRFAGRLGRAQDR